MEPWFRYLLGAGGFLSCLRVRSTLVTLNLAAVHLRALTNVLHFLGNPLSINFIDAHFEAAACVRAPPGITALALREAPPVEYDGTLRSTTTLLDNDLHAHDQQQRRAGGERRCGSGHEADETCGRAWRGEATEAVEADRRLTLDGQTDGRWPRWLVSRRQ